MAGELAPIRGELDAALRVDPSEASVPRLGAPAGREVFQYLGTLRSPGQIAFLGDKGRFVYDFRNNRAKAADGDWRAPSALGPTEQEDLLRLIRTWERMKLARQSRPDTGDGR